MGRICRLHAQTPGRTASDSNPGLFCCEMAVRTICHFPRVNLFSAWMGAFPVSHTNLPIVIHCVLNFFPPISHLLRWPWSLKCSSLTDECYCRRQKADSLSLRQDREGQQSQGLHVVLAFLLHPEVQSLPGSLADPRKLTHKPERSNKLPYLNYSSLSKNPTKKNMNFLFI